MSNPITDEQVSEFLEAESMLHDDKAEVAGFTRTEEMLQIRPWRRKCGPTILDSSRLRLISVGSSLIWSAKGMMRRVYSSRNHAC